MQVIKKKECRTVKDYRPTSPINGIMKILSKILARRLSKHIDTLVADSQSAFIQGRQIVDSYSLVMELISFWKKSKIKGLLFKINFEKAFDNINWDFLLLLLKRRGFRVKWCS